MCRMRKNMKNEYERNFQNKFLRGSGKCDKYKLYPVFVEESARTS